ncbi:MAG TPA: MBG domain-containing protein, partial [Niastella sp.]
RYFARFTPTNSTTAGDGAFIYVKQTGDFVRITSPTAATNYGELTADASGTYTGWFMADPSSSTTFSANGKVKFRIFLNNGNGGISVLSRPTTSSEITVLNYGATTTNCTAIRSTPVTGGVAKNFVMIWDNAAGTGRPVAGSVIESDGVDASNSYAAFYATDVNGVDKAWGTIIPNDMANGIRRISQFSLATGNEVGYKLSSDGSWPVSGGGRTSTVNTTGGLTNVIVLDGALARLDGANVKTDQTITFDPMAAKTYGDADFSPGATTSSGLQVSYSSDNTALASIVNNNVHISGAGSANINAQQSGDDFFNAATAVQQPLTINKAALTITGKDEQVLYGTAIPVLTALYSGFVNGDTEAGLTTLPTVTTPATSTSPIGTYDIIASGAASPNYNITYVKGTLTITPSQQPQTITFNTINPVIYGVVDFGAGAQASSGLTVSYASSNTQVATIVNGKIHITGAGTTTITASQGGSSAWSAAADVTQTLTVNKATLTITADNKTRLANQSNPTFTVSYSGFVYNENSTVLTAQPVVATTATNSSPAGNYDIIVSGAAADNYNIVYVKGTLKIDPLAAQTITFTTLPARKYGDADIKPIATASSKLSVDFVSSNPTVAIIRNDSVII